MGRFLKPTLAGFGLPDDKASLFGPTAFYLLLTIGRLVGGAVLTVISPRNFFRISALLGLLGGIALTLGTKSLTLAGVALTGASELSGLMCMAIAGGAVIPLLMGQLVDMNKGSLAFMVPVVCFVYLLLISLKGGKKAVAA